MTHARSRVILETLRLAAANNKHFKVFLTTSSIDNEGEVMAEELRRLNIETTLILDSAIGYIMETIDFVFVGAEGVMESGGIINRIGTFTIGKTFYYLKLKSFKLIEFFFLRRRTLCQRDEKAFLCSHRKL